MNKHPIQKWTSSHRRLEESLTELADHPTVEGHAELLDFLAHNWANHENDEEQLLVPKLRQARIDDALVARLGEEHRQMRALWEPMSKFDANTTASHARAALGAVKAHHAFEEAELFPLSEQILSEEDWAHIAEGMQARRGRGGGGGGGGGRR